MRRTAYLCLFAALVAPGCGMIRSRPDSLPTTQLEIRAVQTRTYADVEARAVLGVVLSVLQDEGFLVRYGDADLGLLDATRVISDRDDPLAPAFRATRLGGIIEERADVTTIGATVNVTPFGRDVRVRINLAALYTDRRGQVLRATRVADAKAYQELFAKVDKGLFLHHEHL